MAKLIFNIKEIISPLDGGEFLNLSDGYVKIAEGKINALGPMEEITEEEKRKGLDASGALAVPGFVDPHTHLIFAGTREEEFVRRSRGEEYDKGGINYTAGNVQKASVEELVENGKKYAKTMLSRGSTTVEVKSGYGLSKEAELKMLEALRKLDEEIPQKLVPTFLGAHALPEDRGREEYIDELINETIPEVQKRNLAEFCDVFCEQGFFSVEESEDILKAAETSGLKLKIHADEITNSGGGRLAARLNATSADHLLKTNRSDLKELKRAEVTPVLLPGTAFTLDKPYPPAKTMLEEKLPFALGTDFNPGTCLISSLPLIFSLSVMKMGISPKSALAGITLNASKAVDREDRIGSLREGKAADLVLLDLDNLNQLPYFFGHDPVKTVFIDGEIVYERD